jgi:hypothetical protein
MTAQVITAVLVGTQVYTYTSAAMANGDTSAPIQCPDFADKTVTFTGTFGAGGSVTLQGSNDGTNYFTLKDPSSTAITKTSAGISAVLEHPLYVRAQVTAGDGTTALVMIIMARRGGGR